MTISFKPAASSGSLLLPHPGFVSDRRYSQNVGSVATAAVGADQLYATAIEIRKAATFRGVTLRSSANAGNVKMAIMGTTNGVPDAKLAEITTAGIAVATDSAADFVSDLVIATPGIYWFVTLFDNTPTVVCTNPASNAQAFLLGSSSDVGASGISSLVAGYTGVATYAGGIPANFGTATQRTSGTPFGALRVR